MGKLFGHTVYLAGPIEDVVDRGVDWRQAIKPVLFRLGCGVFDPCDKPCEWALETPEELDKWQALRKELAENPERQHLLAELHAHCQPIVSVDLRMVDLSSFVILHIDRKAHMCGSYVEASHARLQRKPMLIHCESGVQDIPGFLQGIGEWPLFFNRWDNLLDYLEEVDEKGATLKSWKLFDYHKVYNGNLWNRE